MAAVRSGVQLEAQARLTSSQMNAKIPSSCEQHGVRGRAGERVGTLMMLRDHLGRGGSIICFPSLWLAP